MKLIAILILLATALPIAAEPSAGQKTAAELQKTIIDVTRKALPAYVFIGGGSGVIISPDGYVLTNYHVAGFSNKWQVYLSDGTPREADMTGYDPRGDIALLKIKNAKDLPFLEMGDSDGLTAGQSVIAIGNPFGIGSNDLEPTVTYGIISAVHRFEGDYSDAIQTDTPINPGNSGGPLIDLNGKIIGINGRMEMRFESIKANTGIGYAIPTNQIKRFLPGLKTGGRVEHGYVSGLSVTQIPRDETYSPGVVVNSIAKESGAEKAGLKFADIILKMDDYPVDNFSRFYGILGTYPTGAEIKMTVRRSNKEILLPVVLEARKPMAEMLETGPNAPFLGVKFADPEDETEGAGIDEVVPDSPATKAGLRPGDIIIEFDGKKIENIPQLQALIREKKINDKVPLKIKRRGEEKELTITLGRRKEQ